MAGGGGPSAWLVTDPVCGMKIDPTLAGAKVECICAVCLEIVRDEPGNRPICGMALEPRTISIEEE